MTKAIKITIKMRKNDTIGRWRYDDDVLTLQANMCESKSVACVCMVFDGVLDRILTYLKHVHRNEQIRLIVFSYKHLDWIVRTILNETEFYYLVAGHFLYSCVANPGLFDLFQQIPSTVSNVGSY